MIKLSNLLQKIAYRIERYSQYYQLREFKKHLGAIDNSVVLKLPDACSCPEKVFLEPHTSVYEHAKFIISPLGEKGKFIMKSNSYAAQGLTIITGNHPRQIGQWNLGAAESHKYDVDMDIVVEEDCGIGANVTLLAGCRVGRGATIGAGCVCSTKIPPYAVVIGNPAQIVGFVFTPEEIIEHEKTLYPEEERLPLAKLEKNYKKYYLDQMQHIAGYMSLNMLPNV